MIKSYEREIRTAYQVLVDVNGKELEFLGTGYGRAEVGEAGVDVATDDEGPKGFSPALMAFALITGQADIGRRVNDVSNPFQSVGGAYHAERTLTLDGGRGQLTATYRFSDTDGSGDRSAIFRLEGETDAPAIAEIRPAFEVWVPNGAGNIHGHFTMVWVAVDGSYIKGEVDTRYHVPDIDLLEPLYRSIHFKLDVEAQRLRQEEKIVLFPAIAAAKLAA